MDHKIRLIKRHSTATEHEYLCSCGDKLLSQSIKDARWNHDHNLKTRESRQDAYKKVVASAERMKEQEQKFLKERSVDSCYCVCHSSVSSCAYCEHRKGDNEVTRFHKQLSTLVTVENVLSLVRAHVEKDETTFKAKSIEIARELELNGKDELALYILALMGEVATWEVND